MTFLFLSTGLAILAPLFYVYDILKKGVQPHRTTRLVIFLITLLAAASLYAQGNIPVLALTCVFLVSSTVILLLSFKYGLGGWEKLDLACLGIALFGIVIWIVTDNAVLALYASIAADFTGVFPTLVKTYHLPKSESLAFFGINFFASIFNIMAVENTSLTNISYPLYLAIVNLLLVYLILRPKIYANQLKPVKA